MVSVARDTEGRPLGRPESLHVLRRALVMGRLGLSRRAVADVEVEVPVPPPGQGTRPQRVVLLEGESPLQAARGFLRRHNLDMSQDVDVAQELQQAAEQAQPTLATAASITVAVDGASVVASMPADMPADEAAVRFVVETGLSADPLAPRFTATVAA